MEDDVKQELEELRDALRRLERASTSSQRSAAREDVREHRADLEDVLRDNGYRLTRRELDEIVARRDDERITAAVDRRLAEIRAAEQVEEEEEEEDGDEKDGKKKPAAKKPAAKKPDEEEEWT